MRPGKAVSGRAGRGRIRWGKAGMEPNPETTSHFTEPVVWLVVFHRRSTRWVERVCWGKWKHVSATAFIPGAMAWVHVSWELARLRINVIPDNEFEGWFGALVGDGGVLRINAPSFDTGPWRPRSGIFCCSMIAHLLGLRRSALLPIGLWRLLIAEGAEIVTDGRPFSTQGPASENLGDRASGIGGRRTRTA